jgi:DNA-3-methyladenine glycosylase II
VVRTRETLDLSCAALARLEPAFGTVIERLGMPDPRSSEAGTHTLLRTIVGQQVSVAAARSMWTKLEAAYGSPPDLTALLNATDDELRVAGISRQKAGYVRSLAQLVLSGELDLNQLPTEDEQAIALLTRIKGIGRWSAEIYLLFAEGRPDIWPAGDLAVQVEIGRLFSFKERPSEKRVREMAEAWRPHRGAAALLAWHSYNNSVL